MTTIQASTQPIQASGNGKSGSSDNSIAEQISSITAKISKLSQKFKDIALGSGTPEEKKEQQEILKAQIDGLQAQLQMLLRRQAEESKQKQEQAQAKVEGVNKPSAEHEIDIYV